MKKRIWPLQQELVVTILKSYRAAKNGTLAVAAAAIMSILLLSLSLQCSRDLSEKLSGFNANAANAF
jgi:hypothetical protein